MVSFRATVVTVVALTLISVAVVEAVILRPEADETGVLAAVDDGPLVAGASPGGPATAWERVVAGADGPAAEGEGRAGGAGATDTADAFVGTLELVWANAEPTTASARPTETATTTVGAARCPTDRPLPHSGRTLSRLRRAVPSEGQRTLSTPPIGQIAVVGGSIAAVSKTPSFTEIRYDVADRVATITLDRPDRLNAFTGRMMREVIEAMDLVDADDGVRTAVFTGSGRGFCAGADLAAGGATFDATSTKGTVAEAIDGTVDERIRDGGGRVSLRLFESRKPLIAAINGPAVGVGVTMTLPMDIRLASTSAKFGFVFARRGIVPEACSSWFLPRLVGISKATEWCFTGRVFGPDEALAGGLVRSVHEPDDLLPAAYALAGEIASNTSAVSVALTRQMLWRMLGADHPMEAHVVDSRAIWELGKGKDAREGVEAFLEKRPAAFSASPTTDMPDFVPWWENRPFR